MKGKVIDINPRKGFVAINTDGGITVVELLGGYNVQIGDIISGDFETPTDEILYNETQLEEMDVCIQGIYCTPASAKALMQ